MQVAGGEPKKITSNPGFDGNPVYSPDGKYIAYHAQLVAENESDRWRVMLYDRGSEKSENLSEGFDRSATNLAWSPDSKTIYFAGGKRNTAANLRDGGEGWRDAQESAGWI